MAVAANDTKLYELIDTDAEVERLATGFHFTEGPVWSQSDGGFLLFSDIPGDVIRRWDERSGITEWRRPSNMSNGLTYDHEGRLLACEAATSLVTRTERDGTITTLASHYQGKELNSPNDIVGRSDGSVYFTDPPSGRSRPHGVPRPRQLDFQGVFRIPPGGGDPQLVVDDFAVPNGLCFSPDESVLYINDSIRMHIKAFEARSDGRLENGRVIFAQPGGPRDEDELSREILATGTISRGLPDGMKADERGNLYCTGDRGVWVTTPAGEHLGVIEVPENVGNLAWGGPDWSTLYICATRSIYRVPMKVAGSAPVHARATAAAGSDGRR